MKNRLSRQYWLVLIAGCGLVGTCLGMGVNISGNFFTPVADDLGVGRGSVAMTLTIYNIVQALTGLIAPHFLEKYGLKKLVVIGTILQAAATFLLSMAGSIFPLYLLNAIRGFGSGLIGTVTVTIMINYWFNRSNALMTSIAMGFSGIVGAIMSPVISAIIANSGWQMGYRTAAVIMLVLNLPALLFHITLKPEEMKMEPYGGRVEKTGTSATVKAEKISIAVFILVLVFAFSASFTTSLPQHFPGIAEAKNLASTGALMISACMVANTGGKVVLGALIDKIGARKAVSLFIILVSAGSVLLMVSDVSALMLTGAVLYGLAYSIATVAAAMLAREMFGQANYSRVYPKVALSTTIANAFGTSLIGFMYDAAGSYNGPIAMMIILLLIAFVMVQLAYHRLAKERS